VINLGEVDMPFSIGSHPGFTMTETSCLNVGLEGMGYRCVEELLDRNSYRRYMLSTLNRSEVESLLTNGAVFIENNSGVVHVSVEDNSNILTYRFPKTPYLGLWKMPLENYVCIEPCFGLGDFHDRETDNIEHKHAIQFLKPKHEFTTSTEMEIS
jgi:galactose mutarotase-like enzyme